MKLIKEILKEYGADVLKSFTIIPNFGGYFCSVKSVIEYTPQKIILSQNKKIIKVHGENLSILEYFQQDMLILGNFSGVEIE